MRHQIRAEPGSQEFREQFRAYRDDYLGKVTSGIRDASPRICRLLGPYSDAEQWEGPNGSSDPELLKADALQFLGYMIDQGHGVACGLSSVGGQTELWMKYSDYPAPFPEWPASDALDFEEVWEGVELVR